MIKCNTYLLLGFSLTLLLTGCKKDQVNGMVGTYNCSVHLVSWNVAPTYFDTTYNELVEVTQNGEYFSILDHDVPVDSLANGNEYELFAYPHYFSVRIVDALIEITSSYNSPGGSSTWDYTGTKL